MKKIKEDEKDNLCDSFESSMVFSGQFPPSKLALLLTFKITIYFAKWLVNPLRRPFI